MIFSLEIELDRIVNEFEKPAAELAEGLANLAEENSWNAQRNCHKSHPRESGR